MCDSDLLNFCLLFCTSSVCCVLQDSVLLVSRVLESSLKISVLIGLVFITFGYSYSFLLLSIYGGPVLSDGSGTLCFCFHCCWLCYLFIDPHIVLGNLLLLLLKTSNLLWMLWTYDVFIRLLLIKK